jgi:tetratricopeptide (TPR) repeat protein
MSPESLVEISFDDYEKMGGFKAAIDREAEAVFALFPDEQKEIESLFQRITEKGEGEKPIRKPETLAALTEITGLGETRLKEVVNEFAAHDLLVLRESEQGGIELDLPHECLEWKWERLKRWIDQEATVAQSLEFLKESADKKQWVTGTALSEALRLREHGLLDGLWPRRYVSESELVAVKEWVGESEHRDKAEKRRMEAERLRGRRIAIAVTVAALVVAIGSVIFFYKEGARQAREEAREKALLQAKQENLIFSKRAAADSLLQSGEQQRQIGRYQECLQFFRQALQSYEDLDAVREQISTLIDIGDVLTVTGHLADAESAYKKARETAKEKHSTDLEGKALESLAFFNEQQRRKTEALDYYAQAMQAYQLAGDPEAGGRVLEKLGYEAEKSHLLERAHAFYGNAFKNYTDSGNELGKSRVEEALERVRGWGSLVDLISGKTYDLKGVSVNVGRNVEGVINDISFTNRMISRRHLAIGSNLHIDDLRSRNGTTINARLLPYGIGAALSDQDIIVLANVEPLRFWLKKPPPLRIPENAWAVFIDGESKSSHYLTAQEYSLAIANEKLSFQPGPSDSAMLRLRRGQGNPQMLVTKVDWKLIFTVKETDYEYKTYIAKAGEWEDPLDVPLSFVKLSPDEKKILVEGPGFQIVFFSPLTP